MAFWFEIRRVGKIVRLKLWFDDEAAADRFYSEFMDAAGDGKLDLRLTDLEVKGRGQP